MDTPSPGLSDRPSGAFKTLSLAPALALGAALALGLLLAGFAVSKGLERFRMADRSITVKGLAERSVEADYAT
ncbi:MAG: SIMPL domain-containing protein, partial [Planctomycetota bacterium]